MKVLETPRLSLRWLARRDAAFVLELLNDPGWLAFIGDRGVHDLRAARSYIAQGPGRMYRQRGFGLYLVELRHDATPVGLCGLVKRSGLDDVDIGFAFLERHCRRGYGLEAAEAVMRHAREDIGLPRVVGITTEANAGSRRILERLGLSFERWVRLAPGEPGLMLYARGGTAPGQAAAPVRP